MKHLYLKVEGTLKKSYLLSSPTLTSSDWICTLAEDPNLPKQNAHSFLHLDSSNYQVIFFHSVNINSSKVAILAKKDNNKHKRQRVDTSYNEANETNSIAVSDRFVTFTKHFRYLGSFVSYNICDEQNVDGRLDSVSSSTEALNHFWKYTSIDLRRKYLISVAIPVNILIWGCESWSLRVSLLNKLEVFIHRSIRRILGVTRTKLK